MSPTTSLSRRTMLKTSGFGVLALTLPLSADATAAEANAAPAPLRRASWIALAGHDIGVVDGPALTLTAVGDLDSAKRNAALRDHDEAFLLSFDGPSAPVLTSGIHQLEHPELGTVSLFVTPVDSVRGGQRYEAIVDRTIRLASALDAPAVEGSAADAAAAAAASTLAVVPPAIGATSSAALRRRLKVRAQAHRSANRTTLELAFTGTPIKAVGVQLARNGKVLCRGTGVVKHGKAHVTMRGHRRLARGTYDLVVTATDRHAQAITVVRSVTIR